MMQRIQYAEGSCFLVPLRDEGFARGLVVRLDGEGRIFAHFFGPRVSKDHVSFADAVSCDPLLSGLCGDLGLLKGEWPIIGRIENMNRENWPLPAFYREDENQQRAWLTYYDDDTLDFVREEPVPYRGKESRIHPYDRLMGHGSVEIRLTNIL